MSVPVSASASPGHVPGGYSCAGTRLEVGGPGRWAGQ